MNKGDKKRIFPFYHPGRWYEKHANIALGEVSIPRLVEREGADGHRLELQQRPLPVLWPWDMLHWRESIGCLGSWIADKPELAAASQYEMPGLLDLIHSNLFCLVQ